MKKTNHGKHEKVSKDIQFHGLRFMQVEKRGFASKI